MGTVEVVPDPPIRLTFTGRFGTVRVGRFIFVVALRPRERDNDTYYVLEDGRSEIEEVCKPALMPKVKGFLFIEDVVAAIYNELYWRMRQDDQA